MLEKVRKIRAKKVKTFGSDSRENGYLIELYKDEQNKKTLAYLTIAYPGAFKGYHLHKVRASHYICLRGKMKITAVEGKKKKTFILRAFPPERLFLPKGIYIGLENIGKEEGWLINMPSPPYDPDLKGEQVDKPRQELEGKRRKK